MFYEPSQIKELESNPTITPGQVELAKDVFANIESAEFERSKYPTTSDGKQWQAFVKIGERFLAGTLRQDDTFTTPLGSFNYIVLDFTQAMETNGIEREYMEILERMDRLNYRNEED